MGVAGQFQISLLRSRRTSGTVERDECCLEVDGRLRILAQPRDRSGLTENTLGYLPRREQRREG